MTQQIPIESFPPLFSDRFMAEPVVRSKVKVNAKRAKPAGKRNVANRSSGRHVNHDAGFIAGFLQEYISKVFSQLMG